MKKTKISGNVILGMLLLVTVFSASSCSFLPEEEEDLVLPIVSEAETQYRTYTVKKDNIEAAVNTNGTVLSKDNYQQKFNVAGTIASIEVSQGQSVKAGQVIATLENAELDQKIAKKKLEVESYTLLYEEDPTTLNEETLKIAERELADFEEQYKQYRIYSSTSGVVTFLTAKQKGSEVSIDEIIAIVSGTRDFILEVGTGMYEKVDVGMTANCTYEGDSYTGKVIFSSKDKSLNPTSFGMVEGFKGLAIKLDTVPAGIEAGDSMTVQIPLESKEDVIVIPTSAVTEFDDTKLVYVWENGIRIEREVELGIQSTTFYEVISGLSEGEVITY